MLFMETCRDFVVIFKFLECLERVIGQYEKLQAPQQNFEKGLAYLRLHTLGLRECMASFVY